MKYDLLIFVVMPPKHGLKTLHGTRCQNLWLALYHSQSQCEAYIENDVNPAFGRKDGTCYDRTRCDSLMSCAAAVFVIFAVGALACLSTCCLVPVKRKSVVLVGAALACLREKFRAGPSGFGPSEAPFAFGCRSEPGGV